MASPFDDIEERDFGLPPLPDSDNTFSATESSKSKSSPESKKDRLSPQSNQSDIQQASSFSDSPQGSNNGKSPPQGDEIASSPPNAFVGPSPPHGTGGSSSSTSVRETISPYSKASFRGRSPPSAQSSISASAAESSPFSDPQPNPFGPPNPSTPASKAGSTTGFQLAPKTYFHSRRRKKGEVQKPWLDKKDPREKWVTIIPIFGLLLGLAVSGFLIWEGLQTVQRHVYCPVLIQETFGGGLDPKVWEREVELGGFG